MENRKYVKASEVPLRGVMKVRARVIEGAHWASLCQGLEMPDDELSRLPRAVKAVIIATESVVEILGTNNSGLPPKEAGERTSIRMMKRVGQSGEDVQELSNLCFDLGSRYVDDKKRH
jgi:hypothetical protein